MMSSVTSKSDTGPVAAVIGFGSAGSRHAGLLAAKGFNVILLRSFKGPLNRQTPAGFVETTSFQELVSYKPQIAVVCSPTNSHLEFSRRLAAEGIHILVEKPMPMTTAEASDLSAICEKAAVVLRVGYHLKFHPAIQYIQRHLNGLPTNAPFSLRAVWGEYLPDWHPDEDYRRGYSARRDLMGGPLLTLSHPIDYAVRLGQAVTRASAMVSSVNQLSIDTEEIATVALQHVNGSLSTIFLDYLSRPVRHNLEVTTENGSVTYDFVTDQLTVQSFEGVTQLLKFGNPVELRRECFAAQIDEFVEISSSGISGLDQHDVVVANLLNLLAFGE